MLYLHMIRLQRGFTQKELAVLAGAGLAQPVISLIEKGRLQPTPQQLAQLARILGVSDPNLLLRPVGPVVETPEPQHAA